MINILLACGCGASSGFIAQSMRKAAKSEGIEAHIRAVSDTEVTSEISGYDVLLIGPHIAYRLPDFEKEYEGQNKIIGIINPKYYASMDGHAVLQDVFSKIKERNNNTV